MHASRDKRLDKTSFCVIPFGEQFDLGKRLFTVGIKTKNLPPPPSDNK